jgi:hypothetical protein
MGDLRINEEMTMAMPARCSTRHRTWRRLAMVAGALVATVLFAAMLSDRANAEVPIHGFDADATASQAGGHPDVMIRVEVGTLATEGVEPCFCNAIKNIIVNTPTGFIGAPKNVPQCKAEELSAGICPADTQVGAVAVRLFAPLSAGGVYFVQPLYNMEPRPGQLALLATLAPLLQSPIYTVVSARTESDYGLEFNTSGIPRLIPPNEITQFTWGVPADPVHSPLRWPTLSPGKSASCFGGGSPLPEMSENKFPFEDCGFGGPPPTPAINPPAPFLISPTDCIGPLTATLDTEGYEFGKDHAESPWPETTGCDQLTFEPTLSAQTTTSEADSPSGLDVNLKVPQTLSATSPSPSQIRAVRVTLPPGLTVDPNVADGKSACTDAQARFGTRDEAQCPEFSKIGTLTIRSSSLPAPLPGYMYLGEPLPGNRYRVFLVADGFSLHIKLPGTVTPNPQTGQLEIAFENLPQTPFEEFDMHIFGAERGLLATPTQCGTYAVNSEFEPWDHELPNQTSVQFFEIDSGPGGAPCPQSPRPFSPALAAGVTDNTSGAHTTFAFDVRRNDGHQNLADIAASLPPGFLATLAGIPYCSDTALTAAASSLASGITEFGAPSCPGASQVGVSSTTAGAGSRPSTLPGKVYLAGPYGGAPLSLAVITPAVSGPYDLGNVVVRVATHVDPNDAHVTAVTDPLPQILEGIPLRLREVLVTLNRDGFALNPTDCSPFSVGATVTGDEGGVATPSNHFQVADCGALDFKPRLGIHLTGGIKRTGHPALRAVLRMDGGEANIARTVVTMPHAELLDNSHIGTICTREQFAQEACPAGSVYGNAKAFSPLLDEPLSGAVYLRSSTNKLPDLVADLNGQIDIELAGRVDSVRGGRLRVSFESVPDAPVSRFVLRMKGGSKGLLNNSENLCVGKRRARVTMVGQNGRRSVTRPVLQVACRGKGSKKKRAKRRRAGVTLSRKAG